MTLDQSTLAEMKRAAQTAAGRAYCPYSKYPVGAAVLTDSGEIVSGCNVENASFGLTICAERNAIFQAIAKGAKQIQAVVIFTPSPQPAAPCGACRQVINEFGTDVRICSTCDGNDMAEWSISELLTDAFGPHNLP